MRTEVNLADVPAGPFAGEILNERRAEKSHAMPVAFVVDIQD